MSNEVATISYSDIERMADAVTKSGLFGIRTKEQAIALMLIAQAEGLHPAIAARDYHIIQNRPTLKADAMLARFQTAGGSVSWETINDNEVTAVFSHPKGGSARISWTMDMAKNASLTGKDVWRQYPRQMLRARVVSEGIRTVFPGVAVGTYTPEEAVNFDDKPVVEAEPVRGEPKSKVERVKNLLAPHDESTIVPPAHEQKMSGIISQEQYEQIIGALKDATSGYSAEEKKDLMKSGLRFFKVGSLRDIPLEKYEEAMEWANGFKEGTEESNGD